MALSPNPMDPRFTSISLAYRNDAANLIADQILPRFTGIEGKTFKYQIRNLGDRFTVPDTKVGRTSEPGTVEFGGTEVSATCDDYGLDDVVPNEDIGNATEGTDPEGEAVEGVTDIVLLDRERRVANKVFAAATYPSANKVQLSGNDQWSAFAQAASDPIDDIETGLAVPILRPNCGVLGQDVWTKLKRHPVIVQAVHGNNGTQGIVTLEQVKELFNLQELYVGTAWLNTARPGQTVTLGRCWGKHAAFFYKNPAATARKGVTFGITAQWGTRISGRIDEPKKGLKGSQRIRVGEELIELILAAEAGYFIQDAVA